jgi:hypothetical protein
MRAPYWVMLGCLAAAIALTLLAESRRFEPPSRAGPVLARAALLCGYGTCVGLVSSALAYFLPVSDWLALVIAVPVAAPVLLLFARMSES